MLNEIGEGKGGFIYSMWTIKRELEIDLTLLLLSIRRRLNIRSIYHKIANNYSCYQHTSVVISCQQALPCNLFFQATA